MYTDDVWGRTGPDAVITITEPVKFKRLQMVDEIKRALEISEVIPFRYMVQHIGVAGEEYDEYKIDAALSALEELSLFAQQRGVELLIENTQNALSGAERLQTFFQATHLNMNVCFDVGHANMHEGIETAHRILKGKIRSTHIHDNNGVDDSHLFPMADGGTIDWALTMNCLRSQNGDVPLMLELKEVPDMANPLDRVRETFDRLEGLKSSNER